MRPVTKTTVIKNSPRVVFAILSYYLLLLKGNVAKKGKPSYYCGHRKSVIGKLFPYLTSEEQKWTSVRILRTYFPELYELNCSPKVQENNKLKRNIILELEKINTFHDHSVWRVMIGELKHKLIL